MIRFVMLFSVMLLLTAMATGTKAQATYPQEIRSAASAFIATLDKMHRSAALLSLNDSFRTTWNNLPVGLRPRSGISVGNMTDEQRLLFHRLLSASLSSQGYLKAASIMQLDNLLDRFYDTLYFRKELPDSIHGFVKGLLWSTRNYFLSFFGEPADKVWGYKVEGHHLSVNFTFLGDAISVTPMFVGTDPAEYMTTEYAGLRVLGQEEDLGLKLIALLTPAQQRKAIMDTAVPGDIITAAESGKRLVNYWGLRAAEMTAEQKAVLQYMIREFVYNLEYEKAESEYAKILKAGTGNIYFGWIGSKQEKEPHYYLINGPGFLIEFDNNGGPRKSANHIHAIWREKGNEYGEDMLRKHYLSEKHN